MGTGVCTLRGMSPLRRGLKNEIFNVNLHNLVHSFSSEAPTQNQAPCLPKIEGVQAPGVIDTGLKVTSRYSSIIHYSMYSCLFYLIIIEVCYNPVVTTCQNYSLVTKI